MKKICVIISLFSFLLALLYNEAYAIDEASLNLLKKQGFEVRMGELTGAGSKLSLRRLAGFIHPQGIVLKQDCQSIVVAAGSNQVDPKISDVTKVLVDQSEIPSQDFLGFFFK
jgi:hypothetical protein